MIKKFSMLAFGVMTFGMIACQGTCATGISEECNAPQTISLFNGVDLEGWYSDVPYADNNPDVAPSFVAEDGMLISRGKPGGHLITDKVYSNFQLIAEYRFTGEAGNCGILVHSSTPRALYGMFPASIECQMHSTNAGDFWCIAENIFVPNMEDRRAGTPETWGGNADQNRHIRNLTDGSENAVGEWNTMKIICQDDEIWIWVNGDLVNYGYDCTVSEGQIAVQAEGVEVAFRKLELTELCEDFEVVTE